MHRFIRVKKLIILSAFMTGAFCVSAQADCVFGAKDKTSFIVLDSHTILLQGGIGADIMIKTYSFLTRHSDVLVLKDSFCSYESAVLYVDGETADANQVEKLD